MQDDYKIAEQGEDGALKRDAWDKAADEPESHPSWKWSSCNRDHGNRKSSERKAEPPSYNTPDKPSCSEIVMMKFN